METSIDHYWTLDAEKLAHLLGCSLNGLSQEKATERLDRYGRNELRESIPLSRLRVLWRQLKNPVLLLLVFAAAASVGTGEWIDAAIVIVIVVASAGVGYAREYSAQSAAEALRAQVRTHSTVIRDGRSQTVAVEELVPGDVVVLSAGSLGPADARGS